MKDFESEARTEEKCDDSIKNYFLYHIRHVLAAGNPKVYKYIVQWMAHLIQRPYIKPGVCLIFKGVHGCGKSEFWEAFAQHIIGQDWCSQVQGMDDLTGTFNYVTKNKVFVLAEEVNRYVGKAGAEKFKQSM